MVITREVVAAFRVANRRVGRQADGPAWLDAPAAGRRATVWQAMGMVNAAFAVPSPDALALLRAHAYAAATSLDDLAAQVVSGQLPVRELSLDADSSR
jgi:hypothetical protein